MLNKSQILCLIGNFTLAACLVSAAETTISKEASYLQTFGWIVGNQSGIGELGLTSAELKEVQTGFLLAGEEKPAPFNPREIGMDMQKYLEDKANAHQKVVQSRNTQVAETNRAAAEKFLSELKSKNTNNPNFGVLPSGVCYEIITTGTDKPTAKDSVRLHYKGTLMNGDVFDSSYAAGSPAVFAMSGVIPGFSQGLEKVGKGGKAKIYIPSNLAYGDRAIGNIPPGSLLIFEVELQDINPETFERLGNAVPSN